MDRTTGRPTPRLGLGQHLVEVLLDRLRVDAQRERRVGLRIHVHDEDLRPVRGQAARQGSRRSSSSRNRPSG